jgi:hypothetical protein
VRSPSVRVSDILAAMVLRGRRLVVVWFALVVAAWTVFALLSGVETGLLYLAPALLLCAPLIFGRYVGEEQLAELAKRSPRAAGRRASRLPVPRSHVRVMQRGGRLVASSLAKRPPPPATAFLIA